MRTAFAAELLLCASVMALSGAAAAAPARDFSTYDPIAKAARIDASQAPVIDGDLSDPAWANAEPITEFYQLEPDEGAPSTQKTVARVLYDSETIYVSFHAYDDQEKIIANVMARDGFLSRDDFVRVYLDPAKTRRDGYIFEVNANGARVDALAQNNSDYLIEWDTIWDAKAKRTADGWTAEFAIPTRSLSFDPAAGEWGFDLFRLIRRNSERTRWASIDNARPSVDISRSGTLTGIEGLTQGLGLDIQAYASARYRVDHSDAKLFGNDFTFDPSANIYYKVTPELTGTLTFNTDFSDTPLDERRVNTGRFSLFFPETRDFFLQDAAVFEFGGRALNGDPNGRPFFSRRIGLADGQPVDILAGGKLSGTIGDVGIGALTVLTSGAGAREAELLSALRLTTKVLKQSELGVIVTNGDPSGRENNSVAGMDFQFRTSDWFGGKTFQADLFYLRSMSTEIGGDDAFGIALAYPNQPFEANFTFREVGKDFDPALGFVNRPGIRFYDYNMSYRFDFQDSYMRWMEAGNWGVWTTDLAGRLEDRENGFWFGGFTRNSDNFFVNVFNIYERVPEDFLLPKGVIVPAGEYTWTNFSIEVESSPSRTWSFDLEFACCSRLGGDYRRAYVGLGWRPLPGYDMGLGWNWQEYGLPTGSLQIHILSIDGEINFTPDMQLSVQAQWDNISEAFGISARYRWEFGPGSELFLAVAHNAFIDEERFEPQASQISARIGHTLRF
jgi:hypothetical protein